jgi:serine/threonine protein kinase
VGADVFVCDMGIAKVKQLTEVSQTHAGQGPGTFPYMAPEMFTPSRRGAPVDMYSMGCLYIELFGRTRVWAKLDGPSIMQQILGSFNVPPRGPKTSHLPPSIGELCSKLVRLDPSKRLRSQQALEEVKQMAPP